MKQDNDQAVTPTRESLDAKVALQYLKDQKSVNLSDYAWIETDAAGILSGSIVHFNLSSIKNLYLLWSAPFNSPYGCALYLNGLEGLSWSAAKALATHRGSLYLNNVEILSFGQAKALAEHKGLLFLNSVKSISEEQAEDLAAHKGQHLSLNGLTTISAEVATALAAHRWERISLKGLTDLSAEAAMLLSSESEVAFPARFRR